MRVGCANLLWVYCGQTTMPSAAADVPLVVIIVPSIVKGWLRSKFCAVSIDWNVVIRLVSLFQSVVHWSVDPGFVQGCA